MMVCILMLFVFSEVQVREAIEQSKCRVSEEYTVQIYEKNGILSMFTRKIFKKVAELTKKHYICTRKDEDSRISCPNQTITEPVGIP